MANATSGNSVFVDSTGDLSIADDQGLSVPFILLTSTAATAQVILKDKNTGLIKADLRVDTADKTVPIPMGVAPLVFSTGINVDTLTNMVLTIIYTRGSRGSS